MPFVFVHGVNTRAGEDCTRSQLLRDAFLREIVAPAVGISSGSSIRSPYWGGDGVSFWQDLAVVPTGDGVEAFGGDDAVPPSIGLALKQGAVAKTETLGSAAPRSPEVAIDVLWDLAAARARTGQQFEELAHSYGKALARLESDSGKAWLSETSALDLADDVYQALAATEDEAHESRETYGGSGLYGMLTEAGKRVAMKPLDALAGLAATAARRPLTRSIGTFVGDAFRYLSERGDGRVPGAITRTVLDDLLAAREEASVRKEPLVVICHSFGGEILHDILTHYQPGLEIDTWVTVGSQVGLFEEMSLLWASAGRTVPRSNVGGEAVTAPATVKRWINIADDNDIFGFLVLPVFTAAPGRVVKDYVYDTGYPIAGAHSGYFGWPSFYKRLASRLREP